MARTGTPPARNAAQAFVDHLNAVLNATVTDARLSLIALPHADDAFEITRFVDGEEQALDLFGTSLELLAQQTIVVIDGHCRTESHTYRLQREGSPKSWLLRWEYLRDRPRPDYQYPLAHVHVNAATDSGEEVGRLHIPTRRVPLELVIWHVIAEWGAKPRTSEWLAILEKSMAGFDDRRTSQ